VFILHGWEHNKVADTGNYGYMYLLYIQLYKVEIVVSLKIQGSWNNRGNVLRQKGSVPVIRQREE
jgi:hypothetical protein